MTLGELVAVLGGKLVAGDPALPVEGVSSVESANAAQLVFAEDAASAAKAMASNAGVVVLRGGLVESYLAGKCVVLPVPPNCLLQSCVGLACILPPLSARMFGLVKA